MTRVRFRSVLALATVAALAGLGAAWAQHEGHAMPEMSPEEQAMMEAMAKASTPGPQHAALAAMAGDWTFEGTFWMMPDQPPTTSTGTLKRAMVMDGRVLVEDVSSSFQGQAFQGQGMTGYDNLTGKHWSSWIDNMSTGMMTSTGTCEGGKCEFRGAAIDPMTGEPCEMRTTGELAGDTEVWRGYQIKNGEERLMMEMKYTRVQ